MLQNAALCDFYIGCYSSVPVAKLEPQLLDILRLGVCQLLFMDKIPVSAAVNEAVEQTKRSGSRAGGLVNAVLRRGAENLDKLPEIPNGGTAQELAVRYSHPLWLCERMVSELGYDGAAAFFAANNRAPKLTVSVNPRYGDATTLVERFAAAGVHAHGSELSRVSVCVEDKGNAAALPGFAEGEFFVQDAAAAMSVLCAAPQKGMRVLDACSAPGGKSLLCASLMENEGEILACDLHAKKLRLVDENAERLGFSIIRTAPMDASKPYETLWESFDLVIADVPCSGMGVIRKKPEIRYKDPKPLAGLPAIQKRIADGLSACVRPGGVLLYSTCTVFREENEDVVDKFLHDHPDFTREEQRLILPQEYDTDGFFYCRMRRNA